MALVDAHVRPPCLSPVRQGEFVRVCWEVSEAVQRRRRPVRDHSLVRCSLPGECVGCELEPGGAEVDVIRERCTSQAVDAVRRTF
jgi:hypothetical protein